MAMESTLIKSPPTSRARAARSWVAVITLILEAAWAGMTASSSAARAEYVLNMFRRAFRAGLGSALLRGTMVDAVWVTGGFFMVRRGALRGRPWRTGIGRGFRWRSGLRHIWRGGIGCG